MANTDLTKPLFPKIDIPFVDRVAQNTSVNQETNSSQESKPLAYTPEVSSNPEELKFSEELTALRSKFDTLRAKYPQLEPGAFFC